MPVHKVGAHCAQWGRRGRVYCGPRAEERAAAQGRAAHAHGYVGHGRARRTSEAAAIAEQLDHRDLARIWDTNTLRDGEAIDSVGYMDGRDFVTFHVTDAPEKAQRDVLRRPRLMAAYGAKGQFAELGPGLYVSAVPSFWVGRARGKWSFLARLTGRDLRCIGEKLLSEVREQRAHGRISESELRRAERDIRDVLGGPRQLEGGMRYEPTADLLVFAANQPYGISWWRSEWLESCGVAAARKPMALELHLRGMFAELSRSRPDPKLLRSLRRLGISGAFTPGGFATHPELVVWDPSAVLRSKIVEV